MPNILPDMPSSTPATHYKAGIPAYNSEMGLLVQFLTGIAWPATIIWIAFLFKRELRALLDRISHVKYKDLEFTLGLAEAEAKVLVIEQTTPARKSSNLEIDSKLEQLRRIADVSPRAAIMEAWTLVEGAAAHSGFIQGADRPRINALSFADWLVRTGKLPAESDELMTQLRNLRNQAAHAPEFEITKQDADRYLQLAAKASSLIIGPDE